MRRRMAACGNSQGQKDDRLGTFAYASPEVLLGDPVTDKAVGGS